MAKFLPLKLLYQNQTFSTELSSLQSIVQSFLGNQIIDLEGLVETQSLWKISHSELEIVHNWKTQLALTLMGYHTKTPAAAVLARKQHYLFIQPWNHQSQFLKALVALNQCLLGIPVLELSLELLEGRAAMIELEEYCPWESLPYCPYHAELGTLICLLAFLTQKENLKKDALRLAKWQLNTLDAHFSPLLGLFVQEKDGFLPDHLIWNYLFFLGVARLLGHSEFEHVAQNQLQKLQALSEKNSLSISPLFPLIEQFVEGHGLLLKMDTEESIDLPEQIFDPSTSLVGRRFSHAHAVCTLHGGHTGLGSYRFEDVMVINYGPQYLPLENCHGFGIEGNYFSEHGLRKSSIQLNAHGFSLKGCVRMVDQPVADPADGLFHMGQLRGIWMEIEQELHEDQLQIATHFLGLEGWDAVAFSFFILAQKCRVTTTTSLNAGTLQRYEGACRPLIFEGEGGSIRLSTPYGGSMQIIPLGRTENFWGAAFLVSYLLDAKQSHYQWELGHI